MDEISPFLTEQRRVKSPFEVKYEQRTGKSIKRAVDLPDLSPQLISKRQELEAIKKKLVDTRFRDEIWNNEFEIRQKEILNKKKAYDQEAELMQQVNRTNQKEICKVKETQKTEQEKIKNYIERLEELEQREGVLSATILSLREKIDVLQPIADYLEEIVRISPEFQSCDGIVQKFNYFIDTKMEWEKKMKEAEKSIDAGVPEKNSELERLKTLKIERNHYLSQLNERIEQEKKRLEYDHIILYKDAERAVEKEALLAKLSSSISNLCSRAIAIQKE